MAKDPKKAAPRSSYDRKARYAMLCLAELVEALPDSIMLSNVRPKRDAFLAAVEEIKPGAWKK